MTLYTDIERLEAYLKDLSPADGPAIDEYIRAARSFLHIDLLGIPLAGLWEKAKMLLKMPALNKWGKITLEQRPALPLRCTTGCFAKMPG